MNQNNNLEEIPREELEKISRRISNFGAILIAVAIIGFCFAIAKIDDLTVKIIIAVIACFVGAVGAFLMIIAAIGTKDMSRPDNFFLYNTKTKENIDVSELTVDEVRKRLIKFMASYKHRGKLYIGDLFDERMRIPEHFKPLFCYELLCELCDENGADAEAFLSFGNECAEVFTKYLSQSGDYELAMKIRGYITDFSSGKKNVEEFRQYIFSKKAFLEERMLQYATSNIKKFG